MEDYSQRVYDAVFTTYLTKKSLLCRIEFSMAGQNRSDIETGAFVRIVKKEDQRSGKLTEGCVQDILTKSSFHPHGIKVRLTTGEVGRVKEITEE